MAWTTPRTWTTGELVTAAMMNTDIRDNMNFLASWATDGLEEAVTAFTNTSFANLNSLTATPFSRSVSVTVATDTAALVVVSCSRIAITTSGTCFITFAVSGATTIASDQNRSVINSTTTSQPGTVELLEDGLTPGNNTFTLQARVSANSGLLRNPNLMVFPQA